jgi:hypothetical protein
MGTWEHHGTTIEHGKACPVCRSKLVRVVLAEDGRTMSVLQLGKLPKAGRAFDVVADHPAYRKSAQLILSMAVRDLPDPEVDPERFGLVHRAKLRCKEVTSG